MTDVFGEYEVVRTEDSGGHEVALLMLKLGLENGENWSPAYCLVLRDDTWEVGAALPVTAECWDGFFPDAENRGSQDTPELHMP